MKRKFFKSKLKIFFGGLAVIVLIGGGLFFLQSNFFRIKQLNLKMDKITCADEDQIKSTTGLIGQNIFLLNQSKLNVLLKNKFICIKDTKLQRQFPSTLNLFVVGRTAVASVSVLEDLESSSSATIESISTPSAKVSSDSFFIDNEGVIFSKIYDIPNIPNIYFRNLNLSIGQKIEDNRKESLKILEKVKTFGLDEQKAVVSDSFLILFSTPKVFFDLNDRVDIQLASLQLILEKAKIEDARLEFVDLRFDKPTVRFAPKNKSPK